MYIRRVLPIARQRFKNKNPTESGGNHLRLPDSFTANRNRRPESGLLRAISMHWPVPNLLVAPICVVLPDVARIPGRDNTLPGFSVDPKDINGVGDGPIQSFRMGFQSGVVQCQDCLIDVAEACIERSSYAFIGKRSRELVPIQPDGR